MSQPQFGEQDEASLAQLLSDEHNGIVAYFPCPRCDGNGCYLTNGRTVSLVCERCAGVGKIAATEEDMAQAATIGSNNPFCQHDWAHDEDADRVYCSHCGADGDA